MDETSEETPEESADPSSWSAETSSHSRTRAQDVANSVAISSSSQELAAGQELQQVGQPAPEVLPQGYYLKNFVTLIDFVKERYDDLFDEREQQFFDNFSNLSLDAQKALVRLLGRKGSFVREDKCQYEDIANFSNAVDELEACEFVTRDSLEDGLQWLHLATKPELVAAFPDIDKSQRKADLCTRLSGEYCVKDIARRLGFAVIEPNCADLLEVFRLLFFGNLYQDMTEFVLHELGVTPYESYPLDASSRYFTSRDRIDGLLGAYHLQALSDVAISEPEIDLAQFAREGLLPLESSDSVVKRRYDKTFNRVARQLERESQESLALELYAKSSLAPSRERQARLLAGDDAPRALQICHDILRAPEKEEEYEFAVSFSNRVFKKSKETQPPNWLEEPPKNQFETKELELDQIVSRSVEETVADYYRSSGVCEHVENGLLPGLFGLIFWEIIFAEVSGVFFNPFQRGPADIFNQSFYESRRDLIEQRMSFVDCTADVKTLALATFKAKYGLANYFVMWRSLTPELISLALDRIPAEHLVSIFRRMLRDLRSNRSGFPDLVVFPEKCGYELVEVKGPGDSLQANQKRWLRHFANVGIPASVVHVTWQN